MNYTQVGENCVLTNQSRSCSITNGLGTQISNNGGISFATCNVSSCESNYTNVSNTCSLTNQSRSCSIANGTGSQSSTNGGVSFGTCNVVSCNVTYTNISNSCVLTNQTEACSIANGIGSRSSTDGGVSFGTCNVVSCNSTYTNVSNSCVLNSYSVSVSKLINQATITDISLAKISCNGSCTIDSDNYDHGSMIVLEGAPLPGYTITDWTGCDSVSHSNTRCTISSVSANRSVAPVISPSYFSLQYQLNNVAWASYSAFEIYKNDNICTGSCLTSIIFTDLIRIKVFPNLTYISNVNSFTLTGDYSSLNTATQNEAQFIMGANNVNVIANVIKIDHNPEWITSTAITLNTTKNNSINTTIAASDFDGDTISYSLAGCSGGTCSLNSTTGAFSYTPNVNYTGTVGFSVYCNANGKWCSPNTFITINITEPNNSPISNNVSSTYQLRNTNQNIVLNATDEDSLTLTYTIVSNPTNGTISLSGNTASYTLNGWQLCAAENSMCSFTGTKLVKFGSSTNYAITKITDGTMCSTDLLSDPDVGGTKNCYILPLTDSFTYKVNDGTSDSNIATVSISYDDWYHSNWNYRKKLVFNSVSNSDLIDFPVLVKLDSSKISYSNFKSGGADIRFVDESGNLIPYEIEKWDSNGTSLIWVKTTIGTYEKNSHYIWMYYGNDLATDAQSSASVWSNGYLAVYHFNQTSGSVVDSKGSFNGVASPAIIRNTDSGFLGNSYTNNTANACIQIANDATHSLNKFTLESWAKSTSNSIFSSLIQRGIHTGSEWHWAYSLVNNSGKIHSLQTDNSLNVFNYETTNSNYFPIGAWTHSAITYDEPSNTIKSYSNGSLIQTNTNATAGSYSGSQGVGINLMGDCDTLLFNGSMDEVRISNVARSTDWMKMQYLSMKDAIIFYGDQQSFASHTINNSYVLSILNNNNDGNNIVGINSFNYNGWNNYGINWAGEESSADSFVFLRFQTIDGLPNTITNAKLKILGKVEPNGQELWNPANNYLKIMMQNSVDSPQVPNSTTYPNSGITTIANEILWNESGSLTWKWNDWNVSPNLSTQINQLATNHNITAGNHIQFWINRATNLGCASWCQTGMVDYYFDSGLSAKLLIEY